MLNLRHLHYLVKLYEYKHFGKAADACFVSQSTLSAAITQLEKNFTAHLIERSHKNFVFTQLGIEVVKRSKILLELQDDLLNYTKHEGQVMQGPFYLGIIPTIAPFILNELHTECQSHYPNLNLLIREDTTENLIKLLEDGSLDMLIIALPYPTAPFYTESIHRDYFHLVMPGKWKGKNYENDFSAIPEHSVFLLEKEHCLTDHALEACHFRDSMKINPFSATSLQTLMQMVRYQPGITFLPTLAIKSNILEDSNLIATEIKSPPAYREIAVVWRKSSFRKKLFEQMKFNIQNILLKKS